MTSELLLRMWQLSQQRLQPILDKLTPENVRHRLTSQTASVGFILLHVAETQLFLAKILLGTEANLTPFTLRGATDDGRTIPVEDIRNLMKQSAETVSYAIQQMNDEHWIEPIENPFGITDRIAGLSFIINHSMYHHGQAAQALKKGEIRETVAL
jgi:uncharacterized damage-inducible protein DinB